ncbi:MAG: hypothetical protein LBJ67_08985 [Planctomycetaceae bacterium]|nr:hypothetical protein [Planctomycetaceae bacterium]
MNLSKNIFRSPAWGVMCITGGPARQKHKVPQGRDYQTRIRFKSSRPCRALVWGSCDPAVALRSTAGYAHHTPAGLKNSEYFVGFFAWSA